MALSGAAIAAVSATAGVLLGWLVCAVRHRGSSDATAEDLRTRLAAEQRTASGLRDRTIELVAGKAGAETAGRISENRLIEVLEALRSAEGRLEDLQARLSGESAALAGSQAELQAARGLLAEQRSIHEREAVESRAAHERALAELRDAFRILSADALRQSAGEFIGLARDAFGRLQESAKGDLDRRQEAVAGLLKPLEEQLKTYQQRLQQSENNQSQALGEVRRQLEALGTQSLALAGETERFRMVLRSNQARGRWGEETLRRVVEASGMSAHCDFLEQVRSGDGQPDMIVNLPGGRSVIIDSKVPDLDFVGALDSAEPGRRSKVLAEHAAKLRSTIRDLARRNYPAKFPNALDHVVLFIPAESLFSAALEGDRDLVLHAAEHRILLATPSSLIALLGAVSVSWLSASQTENTRAILTEAGRLFKQVERLSEHFEGIGRGLRSANAAFDSARVDYERKVKPSGDRLLALGLKHAGRDAPGGLPGPGTGSIEGE